MSGHPGAALYGPSVCALPPVPRSARVAGGGGVDVAALAIAACAVVCRPGSGRELWISYAGPRLVRVRVRGRLGPGGGLRLAGYVHCHDCGRVDVTGRCRDQLAAELREAVRELVREEVMG